MGKQYTPNDHRSMAMNTQTQMGRAAANNAANVHNSNGVNLAHNNKEYKAAQDHRSQQIQAASKSEKK